MGRPFTTLTPAQTAEVETLAAVLTVAQMADYFGIGRTTFFSLMDRDPDVAERYKKGKARAIGAIAQSLISKARAGDTTSMIFFLKTQGGWRETSAVEHFGNTSVEHHLGGKDALATLLDRIAERSARIGIAPPGGAER
jgi:hypothetical protein